MEIVVQEKKKIKRMGLYHFVQMLHYLETCEHGGYYGNKKNYMKRQEEIKEWINDCIELLENK